METSGGNSSMNIETDTDEQSSSSTNSHLGRSMVDEEQRSVSFHCGDEETDLNKLNSDQSHSSLLRCLEKNVSDCGDEEQDMDILERQPSSRRSIGSRHSTQETDALKDENLLNLPEMPSRGNSGDNRLETGVKFVSNDLEESSTPPPPLIRHANNRQTSSASSRPGAFAVSLFNQAGRNRSETFSMTDFSEVTNAQQFIEESTPQEMSPPTADDQPSESSNIIAQNMPIVATLVEEKPSLNSQQNEDIPEAVRTSIWSDGRVRLVVGILILLVLGATSAIVGLLLSTKKEKEFGATPEGNRPVQAPYFAPNLAPDLDAFPVSSWTEPPIVPNDAATGSPTLILQDIVDTLVDTSFDNGIAISNFSSPQYLASQWVLDDPNVTFYSQSRLIQRYVLATIYYSAVAENDDSEITRQPLGSEECSDFGFATCNNAGSVIGIASQWKKLRATIPEEIGLLSNLKSINLEGNRLRGTLPTTMGLLTALEGIQLGSNELTGEIPSDMAKLSLLSGLVLGDNKITSNIPSFLGQLTALTYLALQLNQFTGSLPEDMWTLTDLRNLYLNDNILTGTLSSSVGRLLALSDADFARNKLHGSLPLQLSKLISMVRFNVAGNEFSGTLSKQLFENWSKVENLDLSGNCLRGTIPAQLSLLTNLVGSMLLNDNQLNSTIPTELGRLRRLSVDFNLANNLLNGRIPTEIAWLSNLSGTLSLANNELTGSMPSEFGNLSLLSSLRLENNAAINGTIPSELGLLENLASLSIYNTDIFGTVPLEVCALRDGQLKNLALDCGVAAVCSCCTEFCF